nr:PREDICTED: transcription elongation factor B polypeptide 3-like isoform X2 [Lepisosteus oculatus]
MAAVDVLEEVFELKQKLNKATECKKVIKALKRLQDLDITLDILVETGIGKTVNGFRKHENASETAKKLVDRWKKLVPRETSSVTQDDLLPDNQAFKTKESNFQKENRTRLPAPGKKPSSVSRNQGLENFDSGHKKSKSSHCVKLPKSGAASTSSWTSKECKARKEKRYSENVTVEDSSTALDTVKKERCVKSTKVSLETSETPEVWPGDGEKSRIKSNRKKLLEFDSVTEEQRAGARSSLKDRKPQEGTSSAPVQQDSLKQKLNKKVESPCRPRSSREGKGAVKDVKSAEEKEGHSDDDFETPAMSFESYLSYDLKSPKRKKKSQAEKKSVKKHKSSQHKSEPTSKHTVDIKPGAKHDKGTREEHPKMVKTASATDVLNVPAPSFMSELSPFPSHEKKAKPAVPSICEVPPVFTGQRLNTKMQVYSGTKTTFLPTMMTLYQQCIRALQNNIDLLYEIGGVPFEILEPVLERCTPEQLLRIEECNPVYIGETDHLWIKHCKKDFRNHQLQEYESWREMYLRLFEEREKKLKQLTQSIVSAHSGKPKGRQVKLAFINSVAKPPRDVRRQQEIHGTAGPISQPHPLDKPSVKSSDSKVKTSSHDLLKLSNEHSSTCSATNQEPKKLVKIAPMMAKSLKAFRSRLGRR